MVKFCLNKRKAFAQWQNVTGRLVIDVADRAPKNFEALSTFDQKFVTE